LQGAEPRRGKRVLQIAQPPERKMGEAGLTFFFLKAMTIWPLRSGLCRPGTPTRRDEA
jgi:hypothetical protein